MESDKGFYHQQEEQWPNEETRKSAKEEISSSAKKLSSESAENVDECPSGALDDVLQKPAQLTLVNPNSLETGINNAAVCKKCGDAVELLENVNYRKGLGTAWVIHCSNDQCCFHELPTQFHTSRKSSQ